MTHTTSLAIDFAVMTLSMCSTDFFPQAKSEDKEIREHVLGQYFLEKGYSISDIRSFIDQVRAREYQTAVEILLAS